MVSSDVCLLDDSPGDAEAFKTFNTLIIVSPCVKVTSAPPLMLMNSAVRTERSPEPTNGGTGASKNRQWQSYTKAPLARST